VRHSAIEAHPPESTSVDSKHCSSVWVINYTRTSLRGLPYKSDFNFHHCVWLVRQTGPVFRNSWVSINMMTPVSSFWG
jgi:hypothetical protein